jgi:hypothetical protein
MNEHSVISIFLGFFYEIKHEYREAMPVSVLCQGILDE